MKKLATKAASERGNARGWKPCDRPPIYDPHQLTVLFGEPERDRVQADVLQASLARTARCRQLDFHRIDYPQMDPPEWNKFVTIKLRGDKAKSTSCRTDALATLK